MITPYDEELPHRRRCRGRERPQPRPRRTGVPSHAVYHDGVIVAVLHGVGITPEDIEQARLLATAIPPPVWMRRPS